MTYSAKTGMRARIIIVAITGGLVAGCSSSELSSLSSGTLSDALGSDPLVSLGLAADPNERRIEYNPRSPLVMPPGEEGLVAPEQARDVEGNPIWPDDPDVRAAEAYEAERQAALEKEGQTKQFPVQVITEDELNDWGRRAGPRRSTPSQEPDPELAGREVEKTVSSRELLDRTEEDVQRLRSEQERISLTEPPAGYRTPAPTADAGEPEKKGNWFQRWLKPSGS